MPPLPPAQVKPVTPGSRISQPAAPAVKFIVETSHDNMIPNPEPGIRHGLYSILRMVVLTAIPPEDAERLDIKNLQVFSQLMKATADIYASESLVSESEANTYLFLSKVIRGVLESPNLAERPLGALIDALSKGLGVALTSVEQLAFRAIAMNPCRRVFLDVLAVMKQP